MIIEIRIIRRARNRSRDSGVLGWLVQLGRLWKINRMTLASWKKEYMNGFQWQHRFFTSQPFILVRYRGYESQPDGPYSLLADSTDQKLASFELWPLACPTTMIWTHKERRYSVLLLLYEFLNLGLLVFGKTTIFILINQFLLCFFVAYGSHHLPNPSSAHTSSINEEQVLVALLFKSFLMNTKPLFQVLTLLT